MKSLCLDNEQKVKLCFEDPPEEAMVNALREAYQKAVEQNSSQAPARHERIHRR